MPTTPCALGLDFGTASVRAVVVETQTGRERGAAVVDYPHGVIDAALPGTGEKLAGDWALQHPGDWVSSIEKAVPQALAAAAVPKEAIVGIGVDFTACTVLPVDAAGAPLCLLPFWAARPHAWVKLWKHHAAQPQARSDQRPRRRARRGVPRGLRRQDVVGVARCQGPADPR